jgi:hypothetical protein
MGLPLVGAQKAKCARSGRLQEMVAGKTEG